MSAATDDKIGAAIIERLRGEFVDEALDSVETMDAQLRGDAEFDAETLMRAAHSLKGQAGTYGFATVSLIAHMFETAVLTASQDDAAARPVGHVRWMRAILEMGRDPDPDAANAIIESLSVQTAQDERPKDRGLVVIVTNSTTTASMCADIALDDGFQPAVARTEFEAMTLASQVSPRAVVLSRQLHIMKAEELIGAMAQIRRLANLPVVVISSSELDPPDVGPAGHVSVVRLGTHFVEDYSAALDRIAAAPRLSPGLR